MSEPYSIYALHPIVRLLAENNLTSMDACRLLKITRPTWRRYLVRPDLVNIGELLILAGATGTSAHEIMYRFIHTRNASIAKKQVLEHEIKFNIEL